MNVSLCWCLSPNFGDALSPWLVQRLGHVPVYFDQSWDGRKTLLSGSILNWAKAGDDAWGVGLASRNDRIAAGVKIHAVRGPLTRAVAIASGIRCPDVYGDAAMILPLLYLPKLEPRQKLGIVPHYTEMYRALTNYPKEIVISPLLPTEEFIDRVCACDVIASSSLHGLIVAHSYGKRALWVKFGDSILGDGMKFRDHMMAVEIEPYEALDCRTVFLDADDLHAAALATAPPRFSDGSRTRLLSALPDYLRSKS